MIGPFSITTPQTQLTLDGARRATATFTVSNQLDRPLIGRAQLEAVGDTRAGWLSLEGEGERSFQAADARQYTVQIAVPADAPPGDYLMRLDMIGVENPDEQYTEGPAVRFSVPEPEPVEKPFPWWIVAAAAALVLILAVAAFLLTRGGPEFVVTLSPQEEPVAGAAVPYILQLENLGRAAEGVVATISLSDGALFVSDPEGQERACGGDESSLVCELGEIGGEEPVELRLVIAIDGRHREDVTVQTELALADGEVVAEAEDIVPVLVDANLAVDLEGPETGRVGEELAFQGAVFNEGASSLTGVRVSYPLIEGTNLVRLPEGCTEEEGELRCEFETISPSRPVRLEFVLAAGPSAVGQLSTRLLASSNEGEAEDEVLTTINPNEGLSINVNQPAPDDNTFLAGNSVTFRLRVSNNTERPAQDVVVRYQLPEAVAFDMTLQDQVVDVRSCVDEVASREVICTVGDLASGEGATIEIHVIPETVTTSDHTFMVTAEAFAEATAGAELNAVERRVCAAGCPFTTIQAAINAAAPGDVIGIDAGTYLEQLTLNKNVTLLGSQDGETIVDGNTSGRVLVVPNGTEATVERLILQGGRAPSGSAAADHGTGGSGQDGGGVFNEGVLTLRRATVRQNLAGTGGAGGFGGGEGGPGGDGGGIFNSGLLTLVDTRVAENRAGSGGTGGNGTSTGGEPSTGGPGGEGGGIYNSGTLTLRDSAIIDNRAGYGGPGGRSLSPEQRVGIGGPGGTVGGIVDVGLLQNEGSLVSGNQPGSKGIDGCYVELVTCQRVLNNFGVNDFELLDPGILDLRDDLFDGD